MRALRSLRSALCLFTALPLIAMASQPFKLAVIDTQAITQKTHLSQTLNDELKTQFEPRWNSINELQKNLEKDIVALKDPNITEGKREALGAKTIEEKNKLDSLKTTYKYQLQVAKQLAEKKLLADIAKAIETLVKENKYTLVLPKNNVAYADPESDVTSQVIALMDKKK